MRKFKADGAVLRRSWAWTLIPMALFAVGAWLLAGRSYAGVIFLDGAALTVAIGLLKKPVRASRAVLSVEDGFVRANDRAVVGLDSVAALSIVEAGNDRRLSIATKEGAVIDLVFDADDAALELRAALGLEMAPAAARRFTGHREIGLLLAAFVVVGALAMLVVTLGSTHHDDFVSDALGVVISLVVLPLAVARLRRAHLTCGDEGVLVEGVFRRRLVPWGDIDARITRDGTILLRTSPRLAFELPSRDDADLFLGFAAARGAAARAPIENDAQVEAMLARRGRDVVTWLGDVDGAARAREAYRQAHIDESRLWTTLANPRAEPTARIGAAVALRTRVGAEAAARVRAVAHATSFPDLREALNAVSDPRVDDGAVAMHVARAMAR